MDYVDAFVRALNDLLTSLDQRSVRRDEFRLARDDDVSYQGRWTLPRDRLISDSDFDRTFRADLDAGPVWIHANLVKTNEGFPLITIAIGKGEGASRPRIDVSVERPDKIVDIVGEP